MKRLLLIATLAGFVLAGCRNDEPAFIGQQRSFEVEELIGTEEAMPVPDGYESKTYRVTAIGGPNKGEWTVDFEGESGLFEIRTDMPMNRFSVIAPVNMTPGELTTTVKVDYGDIWKYIDIRQPSRAFFVDRGENGAGGNRYTVNASGSTVHSGPINNPDRYELSVSFVGGMDVFTPVLDMSAVTTGTLAFTAEAWTGYVGMTWGLREATYKVSVADHPELDATVIVRQSGTDGIPAGAIAEYGVPGGYFFRMKYGSLDVAGIDLLDVDGSNWTSIFDSSPSQFVNVYTDWNSVPTSNINPCPDGWRAMSLADAKRLLGGTMTINGALAGAGANPTGQGQNWSGTGANRSWSIVDAGGRDAAFGIFTQPKNSDYYHLMLSTAGCHASAAQFARVQIRNQDATPVVSIAGRTSASAHKVSGTGTNDTWYGVRCVRDTPLE